MIMRMFRSKPPTQHVYRGFQDGVYFFKLFSLSSGGAYGECGDRAKFSSGLRKEGRGAVMWCSAEESELGERICVRKGRRDCKELGDPEP